MTFAIIALAAMLAAAPHSGGLNAEGCHTNRRTGEYHCHRSGGGTRAAPRAAVRQDGAFANCAAARAAGAAPVRRGESGYGPHLDRDGDGVGCER
jgi:hypothetical protein